MAEARQREIWVDNVKVIACVLVVLGHFFQSMTKANIIPANDLYRWFNQTIYYFHVPLFFICSGYLYQKLSKVDNVHSWGRNILKKALNLGIPYFAFSFATWVLKTVFSGSTNDQIGGLFDTLVIHPTSPYWYLYALFFIFLITPTFRNTKMALVGLVVAILLKCFGIFRGGGRVQAVYYILSNEIWFVIGMCMNMLSVKDKIQKSRIVTPIATGIIFVGLSLFTYKVGVQQRAVDFLMGLLACGSVVMLVICGFENGKQSNVLGYLARYTIPIFLMHTLFAAPLRMILLKAGIQNIAVHTVLGLIISFGGPIVAALIMKKSKLLDFFLYPGEFIRIK